jgi:hypothetical protein
MFSEIERIGEMHGVADIPAFVTAMAEVISRHILVDRAPIVEDWHGKTTTSESRFQ